MSTPLFQPVASVLLVGVDDDLADECAAATPHLSVLRVKHAAGAVARMLVTRPLVLVVDEGVSETDAAEVIECANDIRAEVLRASGALRAGLGSQIRLAVITAERNRATGPASAS